MPVCCQLPLVWSSVVTSGTMEYDAGNARSRGRSAAGSQVTPRAQICKAYAWTDRSPSPNAIRQAEHHANLKLNEEKQRVRKKGENQPATRKTQQGQSMQKLAIATFELKQDKKLLSVFWTTPKPASPSLNKSSSPKKRRDSKSIGCSISMAQIAIPDLEATQLHIEKCQAMITYLQMIA